MANLRFQISPGVSGAGLTFDLLRDEERVLSAGHAFVDREACLAAIHDAVQALTEEEPFAIRAAPGGSVLELMSPGGGVLAHSEPLSDQAATDLQEALDESAAEQEEYEIAFPATMTARSLTVPSFSGAAHVVSAEDYDFARSSASGVAGFEPFQSARDGRHYFHFNDMQGEALLYSRGFGTASQRNKRLWAVAAGAALEQRYERREEGGLRYFILKARNAQEIARSRTFGSLAQMKAAMAWLRQEVTHYAEPHAPRARKGAGERFNLGLASVTGAAGFELLRAADRRHYFLFNADDGRPLLFSQGYKARESRDQAVRTVIRLGANPARYEAAGADGHRHFALRAGNRQEIARSRDFASEAAMAGAVGLLQTRLPASAAAFGVPVETLETAAGARLTMRAERQKEPLNAAGTRGAVLAGVAAGAGALSLADAEGTPATAESVVPQTPPVVPATRKTVSLTLPPVTKDGGLMRRFWPVPIALLALACLPWLLRAHSPNDRQAAPTQALSHPVTQAVMAATPTLAVTNSSAGPAKGPGRPQPVATTKIAGSLQLRKEHAARPPHNTPMPLAAVSSLSRRRRHGAYPAYYYGGS